MSGRPFKDALGALHAAIPSAQRVEPPRLVAEELVAQRLRYFLHG